MPKRLIADILAFLSLFFLPWWCTGILLVGIIVFFRWPFEVVAFAFVADLLYGIPETRFHGFMFVGTLATLAILIIVEFLKTRMRSY